MAWLGEPLADQTGASELAPRCRKYIVEEELFARRHDLFAGLSVVFMDTTSLSFEGQGGAALGRRGHSKDYRPDLHQMIVGLVMDQDGRPLCSELWPGNTADVTTLLPIVDRLRARFGVGRICRSMRLTSAAAPQLDELSISPPRLVLARRGRISASKACIAGSSISVSPGYDVVDLLDVRRSLFGRRQPNRDDVGEPLPFRQDGGLAP